MKEETGKEDVDESSLSAEEWMEMQLARFEKLLDEIAKTPMDRLLLDAAYTMGYADSMIYAYWHDNEEEKEEKEKEDQRGTKSQRIEK